MRFHNRIMVAHLSAALPQITNQLLATIKLCARRLITIEIADQTNPERNVVQIIAVHVTAVDLSPPAIPYFDLAIAGGSSVADNKMVCKTVLHPSKMSMVIVERGGVSLTRSAVMHDDELPAPAHNRSSIDLRPH